MDLGVGGHRGVWGVRSTPQAEGGRGSSPGDLKKKNMLLYPNFITIFEENTEAFSIAFVSFLVGFYLGSQYI